jgi:chaperonin GroEL
MKYATLMEQPETLANVSQGFDDLAALLALTLGPLQGTVMCSSATSAVELLVDSGTIARRVVALPDRAQDVGAMLLRNMVWSIHEQYGDGAATAAALARALVSEAKRMIAAGANAMMLRRGIERGAAAAASALIDQACPATGAEILRRLAEHVTGDSELGKIVGEMVDLMGADAALEIEEYAAPYLNHEYLDGGRWRARHAARGLLPAGKSELVLENPLILVVNQKIERIDDIRPALELALAAPEKSPLLIIAADIAGDALNTLVMNHTRGTLALGAAIVTSAKPLLADDLADIATLTGADLLATEAGKSPARLHPAQFGRARRVVLAKDMLTLIGGGGQPAAKQAAISSLRARVMRLPPADTERERRRMARLSGGIIKIGAHTQRERDAKKDMAQKMIRVLEAAAIDGIAPGGGVAYLNCIQAAKSAAKSGDDADIRRGIQMVVAALEAPFRQIVQNHGGMSPTLALNEVRRMGSDFGLDARTGELVSMPEAGIMDSVRVLRGALLAAASAAAMAITTDLLVLRSDARRSASRKP